MESSLSSSQFGAEEGASVCLRTSSSQQRRQIAGALLREPQACAYHPPALRAGRHCTASSQRIAVLGICTRSRANLESGEKRECRSLSLLFARHFFSEFRGCWILCLQDHWRRTWLHDCRLRAIEVPFAESQCQSP